MSRKYSFVTVLVMAVGLATTATAQKQIGERFQLGVGESVGIAGTDIRIGFESLLSDSRCPSNVDCIWEGNATARAWAEKPRAGRTFFQLNTNRQFRTEVPFDGLIVRLLAVAPHPVDGVIIDPADYVVTMVVVGPDETVPIEEKTWGAIKELFK